MLGVKTRSDPQQNAGSRALFYPISIMPQISTKDSGILQLTKNAKTNNNIAGHHVVSRRVISTSSDVQRVYRCPKRTCILPQKYHVSVSNMLLQLLKCIIKRKTNINFRTQGWYWHPAKCWINDFILPHKYHTPNFYRRFCHNSVNCKCKN